MSPRMTGKAEANVARLKRYQCFEIQLARLLGGWLPGIERWEVKHRVAAHIWEDAEHSCELRTRLWELRVSNPDRGVVENVVSTIEALSQAQYDYELIAGAYLVLKARLLAAYKDLAESTYEIYDAPTIPVLRRLAAEKEAQVTWAKDVVAELADNGEKRRRAQRWMRYAEDALAAVGGVQGFSRGNPPDHFPDPPPGYSTLLPFAEARRDERFQVQEEASAPPDPGDRLGQVLWQFSNYGQEMQAAETLGSTLWEAREMPWEFYYDLARHCTDEARHSKLGENRLNELGYHLADFPHSVANYAWRQLLDPMRRYGVLTLVIEADSFKYKRSTYEKHMENGDIDSAQAVLFDMADETMHVRWGKKWTPVLMQSHGYEGTVAELEEECRSLTAKHSANPLQRMAASKTG